MGSEKGLGHVWKGHEGHGEMAFIAVRATRGLQQGSGKVKH